MTRLPMDDLELEMEELEGFVNSVGSGIGNGRRSTPSVITGTAFSICDGRFRIRWVGLLAATAIGVVYLFVSGTIELHLTEGSGGSRVSDVEGKNYTEYTVVPVEEQLTPSPTQQATTPADLPTASPSVEQPTETVVEDPPPKDDTLPPTVEPTTEPVVEDTPTVQPSAVPTTAAPVRSESELANPLDRGDSWLPKDFVVRSENPQPSNVLEEYAKTWGTWQFVDTMANERPKEDYCADYPHRDVPRENFPPNAWQNDPEYLKNFLSEADKLVKRAMQAILVEYGHDLDDAGMFELTMQNWRRNLKGEPPPNGGWTTPRSFQGLIRRLLHAIMTNDTFTVILGGHSAAAGHGNHFRQSYMMQFHKVMEPVFSYLGVNLISRNLAQGGLGTLQSSLGAGSIYGEEMDFLVWDSSMTEGRDGSAIDMFGRQAMIGGNRVPVLWGGDIHTLQMYHDHCDADVGTMGSGDNGIPMCMNETHALSLPYAARYMSCDVEQQDLCNNNKYRANCWVDRPDVIPLSPQNAKPGGQASWHPGFRRHQLTGRVLAFTVLKALNESIAMWNQADGYTLPDDAWHVKDYYENIRSKVLNLNVTLGSCPHYNGTIPLRICFTPMKALTLFTPRSNPEKTALTNIIRPNSEGYVPYVESEILYDGPDVRNPMFDVPEGEIDVFAILSNGRSYPDDGARRLNLAIEKTESIDNRRTTDSGIVPGKGYQLLGEPPGYCDGSWNAICGRSPGDPCLLYAHHDNRGGVLFNSVSGWIVMDVPKVKEGIIAVRLETWHGPVPRTTGWTTVNNEHDEEERRLGGYVPPYCADFRFEFAIDGKITSWNEAELTENDHVLQRVVEIVTLLDDPHYVEDAEGKDVEVAIRMTGCPGDGSRAFSLTHVYWA